MSSPRSGAPKRWEGPSIGKKKPVDILARSDGDRGGEKEPPEINCAERRHCAFDGGAAIGGCAPVSTLADLKASLPRLEYISLIFAASATKSS